MPVLPFLVAGEVAYAASRRSVHDTFWLVVLPFVYWLALQYQVGFRLERLSAPPAANRWTRPALGHGLRAVAATLGAYRLFRTLWTSDDRPYYGGSPLVYQVLVYILVIVGTLEAAMLLWYSRPRSRASTKAS
jgi:hypothetical protein